MSPTTRQTRRTPTRSSRWTPQRRGRRDDRGSVAVEFAIGAPILLGIVLILLQMFAWGMGYLAAHAAGQDDAAALLDQLGGSFVDKPTVTVTRGQATTTVTIRGTAHGLPLPITVTVQAPTERYTR